MAEAIILAAAIIFSSLIGADVAKDRVRNQCDDFNAAKIADEVYTCSKRDAHETEAQEAHGNE